MAPLTLRIGGYQTEASVHTRALRVLIGALTRQLGDAIAIEFTPNVAALGHKAGDLFDLVARGETDLFYFASSYIDAARVPSLGALDLPFLVDDRARIYQKLDGALGRRFAADVEAGTAYRVLAFWDNGFRHLSNRLRPIRTPDDCAGLTMRTTASPLHQEIFAAFGCIPLAVDPADLAQAVATHRVDAQENPLTNLVQFGLYRTHKHVSLTAHFFGCAPLMINRARHDTLPPPVAAALAAAVAEATQAQRAFAAEEDARCLAVLAEAGVAVVPAAEIDRAAFKARAAPIVTREAARIGAEVVAELAAPT